VPDRPDPQREIWVYDVALSLLLGELIRTVERLPPGRRPAWWAARAEDLRVQAMVSDLYLDLTDDLDAGDHGEFARLLEEAAERLRQHGAVTPDDVAGWPVPVTFRGDGPEDTEPVAELGHALADLIRGTLPQPPAGTLWFYGAPGGRSTIPSA
jgi:hypothetical protein